MKAEPVVVIWPDGAVERLEDTTMNEQEWLASTDSAAMLRHITSKTAMHEPSIYPSDRKLRLWAAACHPGVEEWEQLAEGTFVPLPGTVAFTAEGGAKKAAGLKVGQCPPEHMTWDERTHRAALLRCIVGNPFRTVTLEACRDCGGKGEVWGWEHHLDTSIGVVNRSTASVGMPKWVSKKCFVCDGAGKLRPPWLTSAVVNVARSCCDDRAWDRLPILADALEEAGIPMVKCWDCDDESGYRIYCRTCEGSGCCGKLPHPILQHLRGPGPHARGCWVLDLLLGKE